MKIAISVLLIGILNVGCSTQSRQAWGAGFAAGLQGVGSSIENSQREHEQNLQNFNQQQRQRQQDELIRQQTEYYRNQNQQNWLNKGF
jgi:hypothetical protein